MKPSSVFLFNVLFIAMSLMACSSGNSKALNDDEAKPQTEMKAADETNSSDNLSTADNTNKQTPSSVQELKVIASGTQCAVEKAKQVVVKTQAEFDKLWKETFSGVDMAPEKPAVNFAEKWVVAAYLGMVSNGGHSIAVTEVKTESGSSVIMLKHTKPGQGCMNSMAIEFPFVLATVNQFSGDKSEFKTMVEEKKCD